LAIRKETHSGSCLYKVGKPPTNAAEVKECRRCHIATQNTPNSLDKGI